MTESNFCNYPYQNICSYRKPWVIHSCKSENLQVFVTVCINLVTPQLLGGLLRDRGDDQNSGQERGRQDQLQRIQVWATEGSIPA
jgi:hypothetical protein